jgi:hypothetical protein
MSNIKMAFERNLLNPQVTLDKMQRRASKHPTRWIWAYSLLATAVFALIASGVYFVPTTFISVDINPSIVISTNMFDRVIHVETLNDDAYLLLSNVNLNGLTAERAVEVLTIEADKMGYLDLEGKEDAVIVTLYSTSANSQLKLDQLTRRIQIRFAEHNFSVGVITQGINAASKDLATQYSVSLGKVLFVDKLVEKFPALGNAAQLYTKPVKEIMNLVHEIKGISSMDRKQLELKKQEMIQKENQIKNKEKNGNQQQNSQTNNNPVTNAAQIPAQDNVKDTTRLQTKDQIMDQLRTQDSVQDQTQLQIKDQIMAQVQIQDPIQDQTRLQVSKPESTLTQGPSANGKGK